MKHPAPRPTERKSNFQLPTSNFQLSTFNFQLSTFLFPLFTFLLLLTTSCHKTCTCLGYDLQTHTYTSDEVDDHMSGNCSYMRDFPLPNTYSVCNWD